jgi:acetyl esterase/lipase
MTNSIDRRAFLKRSLAAAGATATTGLLRGDEKKSAKNIVEKTFTYKTVGDSQVQADLWRADDDVMRPLVFWIHGGALISGGRRSVDRRVKNAFLDAGYAIVSIDYRLAPETKLPDIIQDVEDAYTWAHDKGPELLHADTSRIAVMGGSAGGYLTLTTGFRAKPRPAVLVSFWGYGDLIADWYTKPSEFYRQQPLVSEADALAGFGDKPVSDGSVNAKQRGKFYLYCRQNGLWTKLVTGFDPKTQADRILPYEPARNVTSEYPPTMLIHGTVDTDVPYEQSVQMAEEFQKHGVEHELITVPGAGHGLSGGNHQLIVDAYAKILPFVEKHVKGA